MIVKEIISKFKKEYEYCKEQTRFSEEEIALISAKSKEVSAKLREHLENFLEKSDETILKYENGQRKSNEREAQDVRIAIDAKNVVERDLSEMRSIHNEAWKGTDDYECFEKISDNLEEELKNHFSQLIEAQNNIFVAEDNIWGIISGSRYETDTCTPLNNTQIDIFIKNTNKWKEDFAFRSKYAVSLSSFSYEIQSCALEADKQVINALSQLEQRSDIDMIKDNELSLNFLRYYKFVLDIYNTCLDITLKYDYKLKKINEKIKEKYSYPEELFKLVTLNNLLDDQIKNAEKAICSSCNGVLNEKIWCQGAYSHLCDTASLHQETDRAEQEYHIHYSYYDDYENSYYSL